MSRLPHCLGNRFTDGGTVVSTTHRPRTTPQKHYFSAAGTHFCWRLSKPPGLGRLEGSGKLKKLIYVIRSRIRDLPHCSIVPQPLCYLIVIIIIAEYYLNGKC
jgi:hypothetical protein